MRVRLRNWQSIALLVDLLCCAAILVPVVWSIRHLREAAASDGKAAVSLAKLRLFRRFYVMVLCYLYGKGSAFTLGCMILGKRLSKVHLGRVGHAVTRVVVYLMESTLEFHILWVSSLFGEITTLVFFVVTGSATRGTARGCWVEVD
jgi:uncharacterized membrane protein